MGRASKAKPSRLDFRITRAAESPRGVHQQGECALKVFLARREEGGGRMGVWGCGVAGDSGWIFLTWLDQMEVRAPARLCV